MISTTLTVKPVGSTELDKQTTFACASALTKTGKEVQSAQIKATDEKLTVRNDWDKRGPLAFKVQPATKSNLACVIGTAADFLEKFVREPEGSIVIKVPEGEFLAIPTSNVRRTKRDIIRAMQRPRNLRGKRDIVLPMRNGHGKILFQRQGRKGNSRLVALYVLVKRAKIKERDILIGPAENVFQNRFPIIYAQQVAQAFATAK